MVLWITGLTVLWITHLMVLWITHLMVLWITHLMVLWITGLTALWITRAVLAVDYVASPLWISQPCGLGHISPHAVGAVE